MDPWLSISNSFTKKKRKKKGVKSSWDASEINEIRLAVFFQTVPQMLVSASGGCRVKSPHQSSWRGGNGDINVWLKHY